MEMFRIVLVAVGFALVACLILDGATNFLTTFSASHWGIP